MPITAENRIKDESTVSRYMQLNLPGEEPGDNFIANENISQFDTNDKTIIESIRSEEPGQIVVPNLRLDEDTTVDLRNDVYTIINDNISIVVAEPEPRSFTGQYNKMSVVIDRDGHTLLFDYTENASRTFFHHPSGSYFEIDSSGDWVWKTKQQTVDGVEYGGGWSRFIEGNDASIIGGDENKRVAGSKNTQVKENYRISASNYDQSVLNNRAVKIGTNDHIQVGKNRISVIGGNEITNIKGFKEENIQGIYVINARDTILLNAPNIELRTGNLITTNRGSFKEEIGGERRIEANQIGFSSLNDINMNTGGNLYQTVVGNSEEVITGVALIPSLVSKKIEVQFGNFLLDLLAGEIDIQNLLANMHIGITGDVSLSGPLGGFTVNQGGVAEIDGVAIINIGSNATEPAILGSAKIQWDGQHTHSSAIGPTGFPIQAADLINTLSKKVFIAS